MVDPERLAPGISESTCAKPTARASPRPSSSIPLRRAADLLGDEQEERDDDHHRRDDPEVLGERPLDLLLKDETDDADGQRADEDEPAELRLGRQTAAQKPRALDARRRAPAKQQEMVTHERVTDVPDVAREVDEDGGERPQLDDGDDGRLLLGCHRLRQPCQARREDQVRRRADGDELREPLHDAEDDCLKNVHVILDDGR